MKDEKSKLVDELFDTVKALIDKTIWKIGDDGICFSGLLQCMSQWYWGTREEFLLDKPEQGRWSFAKACEKHDLFPYLGTDLKDAVRIMANSSSLEEIRLKFAAAGLLPEQTR